MRNNHLNSSCLCQALAISHDGGATFSDVWYSPQLVSPVCMAGLLAVDDQVLGERMVLLCLGVMAFVGGGGGLFVAVCGMRDWLIAFF